MNKYNEALEWLLKVFTSYLRVAYPPQISNKLERTREAISIIKELVERTTPPTAEEVCDELSDYLECSVKIADNKIWIRYNIVWHDFRSKINFWDLPPHLITMIGRFYEGLKNTGQ